MAPPRSNEIMSAAPSGQSHARQESTFASEGATAQRVHCLEAGIGNGSSSSAKRSSDHIGSSSSIPSPSSGSPTSTRARARARGSVSNRQKGTFTPPPQQQQQQQKQKEQYQQEQSQSQKQTSAYDDDGSPTVSLVSDLRRSLALIHEERHLVAYDLYRDVLGRVEQMERTSTASSAIVTGTSGSTHTPITPSRPRGLPFHSPLRRRQQREVQVGATPVEGKEKVNRIQDHRDAKALLEQKEDEFTALEKRAKLFLRAKQNLTIDDWVKAQTLFGITTYYRREVDGSLSIKLEGHLTGIPLFEQLAVLREADLYHSWAPFCVSSSRLAQLGKIDVVAWFLTGLPKFGLSRDACFRAIGCDSMREDGSILLVGEGLGDRMEDGVNVKSHLGEGGDAAASIGDRHRLSGSSSPARRVDRDASGSIHNESSNYSNWATLLEEYEYGSFLSRDSVLDTIQIPPVPNKFGAGRMTIRSFQGAVDVLSPSSAKTRLITNIDPNLSFIPQSLIDYCMKKMCGILLTRLQGCARATLNDPVHSLHARRMREDVQFYRLWLLPKFRSYCEDLGWELPPVAAFNVGEEDLDEEEWLMYSQMNCLQEDRPRDKRSSRMESSAIGDINFTRQQCGERTSSLDGQRLSRRLFSSERSLPGHDRTVASAPVVSKQPHPNGDGVGTKLRQLLPAESMEIALTRPDILQRWEQRQAKKKALEVASARRRAALRLRPTQPSGEQAARLAQLKEAKERFLKGGRNGAKRRALSRDETVERRASGELSSDVGTRPMLSIIIDWLSFTHPSIPHKLFLPIMVAIMFALYHADKNFIHAKAGAGWAGSVVGASDSQWPSLRSATQTVAQNAIFCAILGMYSAIFWIVMNLALVVAFDFIEFPLLSLAGTKRELEYAKSLYTKNMRVLTAYFSMAILALVMSSCFLSYFWNHSLATLLQKAVHLFDSVFVVTFGKDENVIHLDSAASLFVSSLVKWAGVIIGPICSSLGSLYHAFFRLFHWSTSELFAGFGSSLWECICSLVVIGFAVDTDLRYNSWREEALEKSITIFSYSSAFLCSFIAIAFCVFPTKSSGNNMAQTKVDEIGIKNSSGAPNDAEVTAGSTTSFSLASGEIEDSPSTVPRQQAATRSLASILSNGKNSSKSRRFGFRRKRPTDKMTSIRSV